MDDGIAFRPHPIRPRLEEQFRAPAALRHVRRLFDKVLLCFHDACDSRVLTAADKLLPALDALLEQEDFAPGADLDRKRKALVAAHERLWRLRNELCD